MYEHNLEHNLLHDDPRFPMYAYIYIYNAKF